MAEKINIFWFRQDLRIADNPALTHAAESGRVLAVYILDQNDQGDHGPGAASRWWLHHSLKALNESLQGQLNIFRGDPQTILQDLQEEYGASEIFWNRCYEPQSIERDAAIKKFFQDQQVEVKSFNGSLLWEPMQVLKNDGTPYRVFTPYYRKGCLNADAPREPLPVPQRLNLLQSESSETLESLGLLPKIRWDQKMESYWEISEAGGQQKMQEFFEHGLRDYKEGRNFPAKSCVSRLSPYLHQGQISPNQAWYGAQAKHSGKNLDHFLSELGWREFSYSLLYHFPDLPTRNLQGRFDAFPWKEDSRLLERWKRGQTGYPIVDAGMRELWETGYVHNRVRMIVGSFLVKNLLLHWKHGERWFWDCLVDADMANNSASWQWVAGCGADAAPYFRIFNPVSQGQKFDPEGTYTKQFVPELKDLPAKYLFSPWEAPDLVLKNAGVHLGENYPHPIVPLRESREKALEAFSMLPKALSA